MSNKLVLVCKESEFSNLERNFGFEVLNHKDLFIKVLPDHLFNTLFALDTVNVDVDISDETFLTIAKMAQKDNVTFDMKVVEILKEQLDCEEEKTSKLSWRLPTKSELNLMYHNLHKRKIGNFKDDWYWSSSKYDTYIAWGQYFSDGTQGDMTKGYFNQVRMIRAFESSKEYKIGQETPTGFIFNIIGTTVYECKKEDEPTEMTWYEAKRLVNKNCECEVCDCE